MLVTRPARRATHVLAASLVASCPLAATLAAQAPAVRAPAVRAATVVVRVESDGFPVSRATVTADAAGLPPARTLSDAGGVARLRLAATRWTLRVQRIGYAPDTLALVLGPRDTALVATLRPVSEALEVVHVTSARTTRRLDDSPARIEVLSGEDVAEKTEMRPADLRGFLSEMPGVRVQPLASATGAMALRIQGLRPRYTLTLVDGLPLTPVGAGGLDLLQLPPADLRQVEVLKGPATSIHGPAAIGGVVNLVSRRPWAGDDGTTLFANGTSQGGSNAFAWTARTLSPAWGLTVVAGAHGQPWRDLDGDRLADVARVRRAELRPRLFWRGADGGEAMLTVGGTAEDRSGGVRAAGGLLDGLATARTDTRRGDVGFIGHRPTALGTVQLRLAATVDDQQRLPGAWDPAPTLRPAEAVRREGALAEASLARTLGDETHGGAHDLVVGAALTRDAQRLGAGTMRPPVIEPPLPPDFDGALAYTWGTVALFAQDDWTVTRRLALGGGLRVDRHARYGTLVQPRLSILARLTEAWTARLTAARGRSAPTPWVEEVSERGLSGLRGFGTVRPETIDRVALDLTGRPARDLEVNVTAWGARVGDPVRLVPVGDGDRLANAPVAATTRGAEAFVNWRLGPWYVTALYTVTDAGEPIAVATGGSLPLPVGRARASFQPRHTGGLDVTWEPPGTGLFIAVEGFYTGWQPVDTTIIRGDPRRLARPYTVVGALVAKDLGPWRLFLSLENLGDVAQWRESAVAGTRGRVWAPLEGRVLSAGVRWSAAPR